VFRAEDRVAPRIPDSAGYRWGELVLWSGQTAFVTDQRGISAPTTRRRPRVGWENVKAVAEAGRRRVAGQRAQRSPCSDRHDHRSSRRGTRGVPRIIPVDPPERITVAVVAANIWRATGLRSIEIEMIAAEVG